MSNDVYCLVHRPVFDPTGCDRLNLPVPDRSCWGRTLVGVVSQSPQNRVPQMPALVLYELRFLRVYPCVPLWENDQQQST